MNRMRAHTILTLFAIAALLGSGPLVPVPARAAKTFTAERTDEHILVDGLLGERIWRTRTPEFNFRRYRPSAGDAAERTEVWAAYDHDALYVAARMFDSETSRLDRSIVRRDDDRPGDWFTVSIDPYHDLRSGFYFRVSPSGSLADGALYDDDRRDDGWDGVWQAATSIDSMGWTVEIRIPFSQLHFNAQQENVWGINFSRGIGRLGEEVGLTGSPTKVSRFAELSPLTDISPPQRITLVPYAVTRAHYYEPTPDDPFNTGRDYLFSGGLDARMPLGRSTILDATINPDFGQVEVDPSVVNLTDYETFYEEKRPFFTESAPLFRFGESDGVRFVYSRRIGRQPQGSTLDPLHEGFSRTPTETKILGAVRTTSRTQSRWTIGSMAAATRREVRQIDSAGLRYEQSVEPLAAYGAARAQYQTLEGDRGIGFIGTAVLREHDDPALAPLVNRSALTFGVDGWSALDAKGQWQIRGWIGGTDVTGTAERMMRLQRSSQRYFQRPDAAHLSIDSGATSLAGWGGRIEAFRATGNFRARLELTAISPSFELNDLGFLQQADRVSADGSASWIDWWETGAIRSASVEISTRREYDFGGLLTGNQYAVSVDGTTAGQWKGGASFALLPEVYDTRRLRGGPSVLSSSGWNGSAWLTTDPARAFTGTLNANLLRQVDGSSSTGLGASVAWNVSPSVQLSLSPWYQDDRWANVYFARVPDELAAATYGARYVVAELAQPSFSLEMRVDWSLTPAMSFHVYAQPYTSSATYTKFAELRRAGSHDFSRYGENGTTISEADGAFTIDPDGGGEAPSFTIYDSDFKVESLRATAVFRWEFRPGSTMYAAWTHNRYFYNDRWQAGYGRSVNGLFDTYPDNVVLVKVSYLLGF